MRLFSPTGDPSLGPERDFREIESPNGVCWCMTSSSHHQPENLDRSLWVDPSRETLGETLWGNPLGKPSGETLWETLWGNPRGNPRGILEDPSGSTPHHSSQRPQAQKWGIPTLLPTRGKGGKRGGKGGVTHTISSIFLWGRTPRPPSTGTKGPTYGRRKRQKGGGARLARGSDKIDRSHRDEFNGTGFTLIPRFPTELQRSKVYTFPWGHSTLLVG